MAGDLTGTTAIVTGAARGLGSVQAERLASAGAHVIVADIRDELGRAVAENLLAQGLSARFCRLDVTSEEDWERLTGGLDDEPPLRTLVNDAGITLRGSSIATATMSDWDDLWAVNVKGPLLGIRAVAPILRDNGGGAIVNIGSVAGMTGCLAAAYSTTKWAVRGLTKAAALEFVDWGISVNAVHPGVALTPITENSPAFREAMLSHIPQRRLTEAREIAETVLFLAVSRVSAMTGADLPVDGGFSQFGMYWNVNETIAQSGAKVD